jgi:uncharacterized membrane protein YphA (DoxX/SURF4 family)
MRPYLPDSHMLDLGLLVARVVIGLLMAAHGTQKLFGWFHGSGSTRLASSSYILDSHRAVSLRVPHQLAK